MVAAHSSGAASGRQGEGQPLDRQGERQPLGRQGGLKFAGDIFN